MLKYLGSLSFAIVLIASTLVFVIAGTFLEAKSGSHAFAAWLTYQNPVFQLLLWLYFINILFSALNRLPFQKKHIPFLVTHAGLLMLLLGVFIKNHFGVQGTCSLKEGCGTSQIFLPNTFAIHLENQEGSTLIPLKKGKLGTFQTENVQLKIMEWIPHVEESLEGFIKGNVCHIAGLPPFQNALQTPEYQIFVGKEAFFSGKPALFFTKETLIAFNEQGERFAQALNTNAYLIYNKGYGGYGLFAELPPHFPQLDLIAPLTRKWKNLPLPLKREEAIPLICLTANTEKVFLSYDPYALKFKWPILDGKYLIRFQSDKKELPIHLRLKKATQINYPGTEKPYSYEATLLFDSEEKVLSMNHVFEKKGYRFYLANMLTTPSGIKQIQLVVNYDPAKYFITYPGAIFLALGILLLYFRKRYT